MTTRKTNGTRALVMWIASGLGITLLALVTIWMGSIASGVGECRDGIAEHGERICAVEMTSELVREDIAEIKGDVKEIDRKIDRALRGQKEE